MNKLQKKKSSRYLFNFKNEITTTCLLFTADWCEACKDIEPLFNNKYHKYKSTVNFKKINVDDEDTDYTTIQYKIVKIPTIIIIEDGKITAPVKGATLIGNGPDAMSKISMVGNDMALDAGVGTCGKNGQSVPVGVGQPTLKIGGITVGGTQAA